MKQGESPPEVGLGSQHTHRKETEMETLIEAAVYLDAARKFPFIPEEEKKRIAELYRAILLVLRREEN